VEHIVARLDHTRSPVLLRVWSTYTHVQAHLHLHSNSASCSLPRIIITSVKRTFTMNLNTILATLTLLFAAAMAEPPQVAKGSISNQPRVRNKVASRPPSTC
jgi:hypothetical protein